MKKILFLLLLPVFLFSCGSANQESSGDQTTDESSEQLIVAEQMKTLVLDVEGMTCNGCEESVKKSIASLAGVTEVSASFVDSVAVVSFDPGQTSVEEIQNAVSGIGYAVTGFKFMEDSIPSSPEK